MKKEKVTIPYPIVLSGLRLKLVHVLKNNRVAKILQSTSLLFPIHGCLKLIQHSLYPLQHLVLFLTRCGYCGHLDTKKNKTIWLTADSVLQHI